MSAAPKAVDVLADPAAAIARQKVSRESMRMFPRASRKQRKTIKHSDIDSAVSEKLDELDREFRRLGLEFPKFAIAYDTARVVIKNARVKS